MTTHTLDDLLVEIAMATVIVIRDSTKEIKLNCLLLLQSGDDGSGGGGDDDDTMFRF